MTYENQDHRTSRYRIPDRAGRYGVDRGAPSGCAVSKAGGLGIIAGGAAPVDYIREEIHKARAITDKPLGMNIMLLSPNADDLAQLAIDEKIEVLTTGAGNPGKYIADWKNAGIKVMPVVASVALAKRMGARRCRCGYRRGYGRRRPHR